MARRQQGQARLGQRYRDLWCWMIRRRSQRFARDFPAHSKEVQSSVDHQCWYSTSQNITHQKEIVILGFSSEVLEDRLLPISLHMIPVINHSMPDWVVYTISRCPLICDRFVSDEEIQVLHSTLGCEIAWFRWNGRPRSSSRLSNRFTSSYGRWKHTVELLWATSRRRWVNCNSLQWWVGIACKPMK